MLAKLRPATVRKGGCHAPWMVTCATLVAALWAAGLGAAECVLAPSRTIDVTSAVPGTLAAVHVERSDAVRSGDVIASLASRVESAELAVAEARAALSAEANLAVARYEYDALHARRLSSLHGASAVAALERDRAERDAQVSRWRVARARELQSLQQLELDRAREVLDRRTVRAPIDGFVLRRHRSPGEYIEEQPIVTLVSLDPLHVEAVVGLELLGRIHPGMHATVQLETPVSTNVQARVTIVDRVVDAASATFGVRLEFPNPDHAIPAGLKCRVDFGGLLHSVVEPGIETVPTPGGTAEAAPAPGAALSDSHTQAQRPLAPNKLSQTPLLDARSSTGPADTRCVRIGPLYDRGRVDSARRRLTPLTGPPALEHGANDSLWLNLPVPANRKDILSALGPGLERMAERCRSSMVEDFAAHVEMAP